jgi:hypothetical protein
LRLKLFGKKGTWAQLDEAFISMATPFLRRQVIHTAAPLSLALSLLKVKLPGHFCALIKHTCIELPKRFEIRFLKKIRIGIIMA